MNLIQLRKRDMYFVMEDYIATVPQETIASMPGFDSDYQQFVALVAKIRSYTITQSIDRRGYTEAKKDLKAIMVSRAVDVSSRIKAFARNTGNTVLEKEIQQRLSYLSKKPNSICADICTYVRLTGQQYLADMSAYGLIESMLVDLQKSIDQFTEALPTTIEARKSRAIATKDILRIFKDCDALLNDMDVLSTMLRFSNPDYYANYFERRRIDRPNYRKIDFMGDVTDRDGNPIEKVTVKIGDTGIVKETTDKGHFEVKNLPSGIYSVGFSKAGYVDTVVQVAVTKNQRTEFTVVLEAKSNVIESVA